MQISITGTHINIGASFKVYIEEKTSDTVTKYFDNPLEIHVTVSKQNHLIHTDISAHLGRGLIIRGNASHIEPYPSFDAALNKIEQRIRRYKSRLKQHHNKHEAANAQKTMQFILSSEYRNLEEQHQDDASLQPAIIAELTQDIPTLTVSEAVMHMDLGDAPALLFRNKSHNGLNMIYMRPDGNIGWVDPEGNAQTKKIELAH